MNQKTAFALTNPLSLLLDKPSSQFTRSDILRIIEDKHIERITFHYTALDGKLKELKIPALDHKQAERILAMGERVDGSSLFKGVVDSGKSDLYVLPDYRTAFMNPFDPTSLDFVCRYLDKDGEPAGFTMDNILGRAAGLFRERTGLEIRALGELEFFLCGRPETDAYQMESQHGYHSSSPFLKNGAIIDEMLRDISMITGAVKYAHSEVGCIDRIVSSSREIDGMRAEQLEVEFLPKPIEEAADDLVISRWIIRNVAHRHGKVATFAPKLDEGAAGSGLHVHLELLRNGKSVMVEPDGKLSEEARRLVGGLCVYATSLTAFGNTQACSYLRLVPDHEAPTKVCWSDLNRSALIRVPLGWRNLSNLAAKVNPQQKEAYATGDDCRQTVELRSADGSALIHLLLAGITAAAGWAFEKHDGVEDPLVMAEKLYVVGNIFKNKELLGRLPSLPGSCVESGRLLLKKRELYERNGIFPAGAIDYAAAALKAEDDEHLYESLKSLPEDQQDAARREVMHRDIHKN